MLSPEELCGARESQKYMDPATAVNVNDRRMFRRKRARDRVLFRAQGPPTPMEVTGDPGATTWSPPKIKNRGLLDEFRMGLTTPAV